MIECCDQLHVVMKVQTGIINKHIDEHKWCNHIEDRNEAIADFVGKFGWIMRETYCNTSCAHKDICMLRKQVFNVDTTGL